MFRFHEFYFIFTGFNQIREPLVPLDKILIPVLHVKSGIAGVILTWLTTKPKKKRGAPKKESTNSSNKKVTRRALRGKQKVVYYEESETESTIESDSEYEPPQKRAKSSKQKEPYGENNAQALQFLRTKFKNFVPANIQGKQVNKIIESNEEFCKHLLPHQQDIWLAFSRVVTGFLGRHRDEEYVTLVSNLMDLMKKNKIKCTLKVHILGKHLDRFSASNSDFSDEAGEKFHHEINPIVERHHVAKEKLQNLLADYYWRLKRKTPEDPNKRQFRNAARF